MYEIFRGDILKMDICRKLLVLGFCALSLCGSVCGVLDQDGYTTYENLLCDGKSMYVYNHTGALNLEPSDCVSVCQGQDGCIAFSVDVIKEQCLLFDACDTMVDDAVYTTYTAVYCGSPPGLANGRPMVKYFYYNYAADYSCVDGYNKTGDDTVMCNATGSWAGTEPVCSYNSYRCELNCTLSDWLECPPSYVIQVIYSNYGYVTGKTCTPMDSPLDCLNYESNEEVQSRCNGMNSCNVTSDPLVPVVDCMEGAYLLTEYICVEPTISSVETCYASCMSQMETNLSYMEKLTSEGAQLNVTCDEGYEIAEGNITEVVLCNSDGSLVGGMTVCNRNGTVGDAINCDFIALENGTVTPPNTTAFMTTAIFSCDEGFTLEGDMTVTCQSNETWSGNATCMPVDCGNFTTSNSSIDFSGGTTYTDTVVVTCLPGYELVPFSDNGSVIITCESSAIWSIQPDCYIKNCSTPPNFDPNGSINFVASTVGTQYGEELEYFCDEGYLPPETVIRCGEDGNWNNTHTCTAIGCPDPSTYELVNSTTYTNSLMFQSVVTVECDAGYEFLPDGTATCEQDEQWSPTIVCQVKNCGQPGDADNAEPVNVTSMEVGDNATYTCLTGHEISDGVTMATITCDINATWTEKPVCDPVQCQDPMYNYGNVANYTSTGLISYLSVATITCVKGYAFLPLTTTCQDDKSWDPPISCTKVGCGSLSSVENAMLTSTPENTTYGELATYTCDEGYETADGNTTGSVICQADSTWSPAPVCEPVDCGVPLPVTSGLGGPQYSTTTYLSEVTYTCIPGYTLFGNDTGICEADKMWSIPPSSCELITCPPIAAGPNQAGINNAVVGTIISYYCDAGYTLNGAQNITCIENGTWDHSVPACDRIFCGAPEEPVAAFEVNNEGFLFEATITYQCNTGYQQSAGNRIITCLDNGTWDSISLICSRISCPPAPVGGANGVEDVQGVLYNDTILYSCLQGYKLVAGVLEINECTASGNWLQPTASDCEIKDCGTPDTVITDGTVEYTTTTYGSTVVYMCSEGFLPFERVHYCVDTETWNGTAPSCEPVDCSEIIEQVANGTVAVGNDPVVGHNLTYSCDNGFNLNGTASLECTIYGNWSAPVPSCDPVDCGAVSSTLDNGNVTISGTTFTHQVTYTCNDGYLLTGSNVSTCTANATWTDIPPTCPLIRQVRVLTYVTTSLDCDDYNEASLAALLTAAAEALPANVLALLKDIAVRKRVSQKVAVKGISCNSPLQFLFEVLIETTDEEVATEELVSNALQNLTAITTELQVDGQLISIDFNNVKPSTNTAQSCGQGYYTDVTTLECVPCPKNYYQPTGIPELCLACPEDTITDAAGQHGDRDNVCKETSSALTIWLAIGIPVGVIFLILFFVMIICCMKNSGDATDLDEVKDSMSQRDIYDQHKMKYGLPIYRYDASFGKRYPFRF